MGGGTTIEQPSAPPAPPSGAETSREAIQAQIESLPQILEAQQEFGPQFSQQQLQALQQFGPQFAETALGLQREFAPQFAEVERQLAPELAESQRTLTDFLRGTDEEEFSRLAPGLIEQVRAGQSVRGLGDISPLGAIDESVQVQQLRESLRNRRLNIALSTAGRTPISNFPQVQGQTGVGQLVQNISPESIFGRQSSIDQLRQQQFATQANLFNQQPGGILGQIAGGIGGAVVSGAGAAAGAAAFCWVAAQVFGGWYEPKTMLARSFIAYKAPKWFKNLYIKYGERFAKFISNKSMIKAMVKPLFELFAWIGGRHG